MISEWNFILSVVGGRNFSISQLTLPWEAVLELLDSRQAILVNLGKN